MKNSVNDFINPIYQYFGERDPANIVFNNEMQKFSYQINLICILHTKGEMTSESAYQAIEELVSNLEESKKEFDLGRHSE